VINESPQGRVVAKRISVLGINGSPQKNGLCARLLKRALKASEAGGASVDLIDLVDHERQFFALQHQAHAPEEIQKVLRMVKEADCFILASPVHWFNVSALMKNFIDHLTTLEANKFQLEGKVVSFIATANEDGALKAVLDMAGPLGHMGVVIPPYGMFFCNKRVARKSEKQWMLEDWRLAGANVVKMAEAIKGIDKWD
jgi:multimeric flavodoxin WrbA